MIYLEWRWLLWDDDDDNCYDDGGNSTMSFIHHPSFKNLWEYM